MKNKIQVTDIWGKVLFEYEKENNTLKDTLIEANRSETDLSYTDLKGANLYGDNLRGVNLRGANLRGVNLSNADLRGADLREADISGVNLRGADLSNADLREANLYEAKLRGADLRRTDFRGAYLRNADLRGADLSGVNLSGVILEGANLKRVNLEGANLYGIYIDDKTKIDDKYLESYKNRIPQGDLVGYKKCRNNVIVKLLIPKNAKRSCGFTEKCRAEYVKVLEVIGDDIGISVYDDTFIYKKDKIVNPLEKFDDRWYLECESGIHFFLNRDEAENY